MEPINPTNKRCEHCNGRILNWRPNKKYCDTPCRKAASNRRRRMAAKAGDGKYTLEHIDGLTPGSAKNLDKLSSLIDSKGLFDKWRANQLTLDEIAVAVGVEHRNQVKRAIDKIITARAEALAAADWVRDPQVDWLLALDLDDPDPYDHEECMAWAREAAVRFLAYEDRFFVTPNERTGKIQKFIRKEFHIEWIVETLFAIVTGGYLQILSPPRHGKSQLMAHFSAWLINRNPNIRIMWIGPKESTAARFVDLVKIKLGNVELVEATLPPGQSYEPLRKGDGAVWKRGEFVVDCRLETVVGSTMLAVGRGSNSILSLNADVIMCDDIENHQSCELPGNRASTRSWFGVELDSRKMEHTAMIVIGSRQHPEDLYSYNLENPTFRNVVNSAHDTDCPLDPEDYKIHVDCVLFPELRSYAWLRSKEIGGHNRESEGEYAMVYLNDPRASGLTIFDPDEFDQCRNQFRVLGPAGLHAIGKTIPNHRRIASLDPSATGFQAAVAFGVTAQKPRHELVQGNEFELYDMQDFRMKRWILDMVSNTGGGVMNFLALAERWRIELGIHEWVIEEKGFQNYRIDPRVQAWKRRHDVTIHPHRTETNKWHTQYGVGAMARLFRDHLIDMPYGDGHSRGVIDRLRRQAMAFVNVPATASNRLSDSLMCLWFAQKQIRLWEKEYLAELAEVELAIDNDYPASYPGLAGFTDTMNHAPWS